MMSAKIVDARRQHFLMTQTMVSGHPGSKRPGQKAYKCGRPNSRHNRRLRAFNELCYERGILHAVRRDFREVDPR